MMMMMMTTMMMMMMIAVAATTTMTMTTTTAAYVITVILLHCCVFLFLIMYPFQSMIYIALTFHSACKQVVIVIVNTEHSNDLIQAVTESVKLSKNIVLREPKGCLPRKKRLIFN
jgi:hypothetical protein